LKNRGWETLTVEESVIETCTRLGVTVATAESCTGGLIGSLLVDVPGSSKVYFGGVTAYANAPKRDLLQVPEETLRTHGSVSAECVSAMAEGARRAFGCSVAIAESGIAGPTGGGPDRPIGTVWIALATPDGVTTARHQFPGARRAYKLQVAEAALGMLLEWLRER
jgi:PncC family amidohydrolase